MTWIKSILPLILIMWVGSCISINPEQTYVPKGENPAQESSSNYLIGDLSLTNPGRWSDGTAASSALEYLNPSPPYYGSSANDGYYMINTGDKTNVYLCDMTTDGGGWTRVMYWNREIDNHSLNDFYSSMSNVFDNMGQWTENTDHIQWDDFDGTADVMAYICPIPVTNGGDIILDLHYKAISFEGSGTHFFARTDDGQQQDIISCSNYILTDFSPEEQAFAPHFITTNTSTVYTWDMTLSKSYAKEIASFHVISFVDGAAGGDSSLLYRLGVWIR